MEQIMFAHFPLQAGRPNARFIRFADWWPAALVGLVALMGVAPNSNARTLLGLF
jgi:hypothetical protein